MEKLYQVLKDVSSPRSPNYGKYWSFEEVGELTSNPNAKSHVLSYLSQFVTSQFIFSSPFTNFIRVETDVQTAEKILNGKYHTFYSKQSEQVITRTLEIHIPDELSKFLDYISPTVDFPHTFTPLSTFTTRRTKEDELEANPHTLNEYYNISSNKIKSKNVTQSVFSMLDQSFSPDDLKTFQKHFDLPKDQVDTIIGKNKPEACEKSEKKSIKCSEGNLDTQYIMSIARHAPTTFWISETALGFHSWIEDVAADPNPPLVHSISYGSLEDFLYHDYQFRFSEEAAKLGARGVTIVAASGDDGVASFAARHDKKECGFRSLFPANVPFVLSVGGTMGLESGKKEISCQSDKGAAITSGGGFSTTFARPDYQDSLVQKYLSKSHVVKDPIFPGTEMFNSSGRAIPDVAIAAEKYLVVLVDEKWWISGTSASAPVWGGILSLVNDARLKKGKSPVGFVNPALYELFELNPSIFHDITIGDNRCTASSICCKHGFPAANGWDPVTGLGSVDVDRLIQTLKKY